MRPLLILAATVLATQQTYPVVFTSTEHLEPAHSGIRALALCEAYTRLARTPTERAEAWWTTELTWREIEAQYREAGR